MCIRDSPKGTGKLDVHSFVTRITTPATNNVNWFRDKDTYEFHVLNRAPMKKVSGKPKGVRWLGGRQRRITKNHPKLH